MRLTPIQPDGRSSAGDVICDSIRLQNFGEAAIAGAGLVSGIAEGAFFHRPRGFSDLASSDRSCSIYTWAVPFSACYAFGMAAYLIPVSLCFLRDRLVAGAYRENSTASALARGGQRQTGDAEFPHAELTWRPSGPTAGERASPLGKPEGLWGLPSRLDERYNRPFICASTGARVHGREPNHGNRLRKRP